jgi:hypothetical protein
MTYSDFPLFPDISRHIPPEMTEEILRNPKRFEEECRRLSILFGRDDNLRFRLALAMYLLGPGTYPPPEGVFFDLLGIIQGHLSIWKHQKTRLLEFVTAYGCGWQRTVPPSDSGWGGLWQASLRALARLVETALETADAGLRAAGVNLKLNPGKERQALAHRIVFYMINPERELDLAPGSTLMIVSRKECTQLGGDIEEIPLGAKCVLGVKGAGACLRIGADVRPVADGTRVVIACCEDRTEIRLPETSLRLEPGEDAALDLGRRGAFLVIWQCACGSKRCAERHRVSCWDLAYSLRAFVAAAVKGVTRKGGKVRDGFYALQQGMYYPLLVRGIEAVAGSQNKLLTIRVRLVRAALIRCTGTSEDLHKPYSHMDAVCPKCDQPFDPTRMKMLESKAYFIAEGSDYDDRAQLARWRPGYERQAFCRCNNLVGGKKCNNLVPFYFDKSFNEQALCHHKHCSKPLLAREKLDSLLKRDLTSMAALKKLRKMRARLILRGGGCPHCHKPVREIPWTCPFCGACNFGQNLVLLYWRTRYPHASMPMFPVYDQRPTPDDLDDHQPEEGET